MTLPAAYATISMGDINVELGRSRTAYISLNSAEAGAYAEINTNSTSRPSPSDPATMSEWYGYNHSAAPAVTYTWNGMWWLDNPCSGTTTLYYGSDGSYYKTNDYVNYTNVNYQYFNAPQYEDAGGWFYALHRAIPGTSIYDNLYGDTFSYCAPF